MSKTKLHNNKKYYQTRNKNSYKELLKKITDINPYLVSSISMVLIIYFFSLFRPWQPFDERIFYKETLFPIPKSFSEIFEVINSFVSNYHSESENNFFSAHLTIRSNPIAAIVVVFISYFFKKSAFLYHLLQLSIHLINTALVWLILNKTIVNKNENTKFRYLFVSFITVLWSLHSANTEAVLLVTNWDTLLTYTFCFSFLLYEVSLISKNNFNASKLKAFLISILFCLTMFFTEYGYTLPFIMFFVLLGIIYKQLLKLRKAISISLQLSFPYFLGLLLFIFFSSGKPDSPLVNLLNGFEKYTFIERNLWLVPQIFFHFLKLLIFPKTLSTYQSNLVHLSNNLFEPYSIFCASLYFSFLLLPIILFILFKKKSFAYLCSFIYAFFFALLPFLHILVPTYCLSADRYCYFPSFILLFFASELLWFILNMVKIKPIIIGLSCLLTLVSFRTLIRISEWNNSVTLYKSAIRTDKNPLYKGHRLMILADFLGQEGKQASLEKYLQESLKNLHKALKQLNKLKNSSPDQPITLKLYGLDYDSLILKAAYAISAIRNDNYREPPKDILAFYEPYIEKDSSLASANQIALHGEILLRANETEKAKNVLENGHRKFRYSSEIIYQLADVYFLHEKNLDKTFKILQEAYKYFPNQTQTLYKLLKYSEAKDDPENTAKFAYLLGLREHSADSYLKAAQIYLDYNQLALAHKTLKKLVWLTGENPVTLLLTSRYLDLIGKREQILPILNKAYFLAKSLKSIQDTKILKSILISLVNVNSHSGNIDNAKKYLSEFENLKDLTQEEKRQAKELKVKLNQANNKK